MLNFNSFYDYSQFYEYIQNTHCKSSYAFVYIHIHTKISTGHAYYAIFYSVQCLQFCLNFGQKKILLFFVVFSVFTLSFSVVVVVNVRSSKPYAVAVTHSMCVWVKNISNRKFHKIFLGFAYCCVFSIKNFVIFFLSIRLFTVPVPPQGVR